MADVALASGVSKATVSKALDAKRRYYVADLTRQRVEEVSQRLGFQPSSVARNLRVRRTWTIGVVVPSLRNPFYPDLVAGVADIAGPAGYTLLHGTTNGDSDVEGDVVRTMSSREVDGLVMAGARSGARDLSALRDSGLPAVLASRDVPGAPLDTVVVDNRLGARLAVAHLAQHGHERIAHVAGPSDVAPFLERARGWSEELSARGLPAGPELSVRTSGTQAADGAEAVRDLLGRAPRPSAVFVGNDLMALGALQACVARGVRVPQDLAIVGFDNVWVGAISAVPLTTVDSRAEDVGRRAADLLLAALDGESPDGPPEPRTVVLAPELVVRGSCGCPTDGAPTGSEA